jgi:hypothetical protein
MTDNPQSDGQSDEVTTAPVPVIPDVPTSGATDSLDRSGLPTTARRGLNPAWLVTMVFASLAVAFCTWALVVDTYTPGNRVVAALGALLVTTALATIAHAALLSYQSQVRSGPAPTSGVAFRERGLKAACMGADGRASTSKTGIVVWTAAVVTALIYLLLLSRTVQGAGLFLGAVNQNWRPEYLVLLGLPAAAATVAAASVKSSNRGQGPDITADAVAGRYTRPPLSDNIVGLSKGLAELITDDNGIIAWADLQYVAFNFVTLIYFVSQVLASPKDGLPPIPAALLTLMGVSSTTYAANKVVETHSAS